MKSDLLAVARAIAEIVAAMPAAHVHAFASAVSDAADPANASHALAALANPAYRQHAERLLAVWADVSTLSGAAMGLAAQSALASREDERARERVEVVATGPTTPHVALRQTRAVVLDLLAGASREVLLVSYSVHAVPELMTALDNAASRGVCTRIVAETSEGSGGFLDSDPRRTFAPLGDRVELYTWPRERRPHRRALLHAKVAVADRQTAFVTSANLSEPAMDGSLEVGVLVRGGPVPEQLAEHFHGLIARGELRGL